MSESRPKHSDHQLFLEAIASKRRLSVRYFHRKEKKELVQICAALDFGPLRGADDGLDYYQLWDLQAKRRPQNRVVLPADLVSLTLLDETFDPAEFITWSFKPGAWTVTRDWGAFS